MTSALLTRPETEIPPVGEAQTLHNLFTAHADLERTYPIRLQELNRAIEEARKLGEVRVGADEMRAPVNALISRPGLGENLLNEILRIRDAFVSSYQLLIRDVEQRINALLPESLRFAGAVKLLADGDGGQDAASRVNTLADALTVAAALAASVGALPVAFFLGGAAIGLYSSTVFRNVGHNPFDKFESADGN